MFTETTLGCLKDSDSLSAESLESQDLNDSNGLITNEILHGDGRATTTADRRSKTMIR